MCLVSVPQFSFESVYQVVDMEGADCKVVAFTYDVMPISMSFGECEKPFFVQEPIFGDLADLVLHCFSSRVRH